MLSVASDAALLSFLRQEGSWHLAGLHWRTRFLLAGEVYRHIPSQTVFRALSSQTGACLGWVLEPANRRLDGRASDVQDCFQMSSQPPLWFVVLDYEEFEALPCKVLSPYGIYSRGMSSYISSGVVLWQDSPRRAMLPHAAWKIFQGLREADLQLLAKELQLNLTGFPSCFLVTIFFCVCRPSCLFLF